MGWEGDLDSDADSCGRKPPNRTESPGPFPDDSSFNEELIEDRYAALQAWTEWTRNQGRLASENVTDPASGINSTPVEEAAELEAAASSAPTFTPHPAADAESTAAPVIANVRAEPQHEFAPYSQLFTRLRQSR